MTREQRAKQFMPFDAMKGLADALRNREEKHSRVEKHDVSEENREKNFRVLSGIERGMTVEIDCYRHFHDVSMSGIVVEINFTYGYLILDEKKIFFDDIYRIKITD